MSPAAFYKKVLKKTKWTKSSGGERCVGASVPPLPPLGFLPCRRAGSNDLPLLRAAPSAPAGARAICRLFVPVTSAPMGTRDWSPPPPRYTGSVLYCKGDTDRGAPAYTQIVVVKLKKWQFDPTDGLSVAEDLQDLYCQPSKFNWEVFFLLLKESVLGHFLWCPYKKMGSMILFYCGYINAMGHNGIDLMIIQVLE